MTTRIGLWYRLRPGVERATYEQWVREADAPFVRSRPTVLDYVVVRVAGRLGDPGPAPFDYFESVEVSDLEADQALLESGHGARLTAEWQNFVTDAVVVFGDTVVTMSEMDA